MLLLSIWIVVSFITFFVTVVMFSAIPKGKPFRISFDDKEEMFFGVLFCGAISACWFAVIPVIILIMFPAYFAVKIGNNLSETVKGWKIKIKEKISESLKN